MSNDFYAIQSRRTILMRLTGAFLVALAAYDLWQAQQLGVNFWGALLGEIFVFYIGYTSYSNLLSWIVSPVPQYYASPSGRRTALFIIMILLILLTFLIFATWIGSTDGLKQWIVMAVVPIFVVQNWVLLALLLGVTDRLPRGWEQFWNHSSLFPDEIDSKDRQALLWTLLAVLIGIGATVYRSYRSFGTEGIEWAILGSLLISLCVLGMFFWAFRGSKLWGLFILGLWTLFNTFSAGLQVAYDLGFYFTWLLTRLSGIVTGLF